MQRPLLQSVIVFLIAVIFAIDAFTSLDIAIAVLYVVAVLATVRAWPRALVPVTALCMVLTLAAFLMSHWGGLLDDAALRCGVSLAAIAITGYLAQLNRQATERLLQREESLRQSRLQLAHVTRTATLGELASSIAHEVNQPLAAITLNGQAALRWLRRSQPDLGEAEGAIERLLADTARAGEVIQRIRAMARRSEPQQLPLDINDVACECRAMVQHELRSHRVALSLELAPQLPPVLADRVQLQQVVINLLMNAMQAMDEQGGGSITLRTGLADGQVMLAVTDSGPGIPAHALERLFEPFFTTRREGMGMGLPICRTIIDAHHGRICAESTPGAGATFRFSLPAHGSL